MNSYRVLGLSEDATELEVKRAYARLIKQHRPDSDPQGFQRIHEAYRQCLAHARHLAEHGPDRFGDDEVEETACEAAAAESINDVRHASSGGTHLHTDAADAASLHGPDPAPTDPWPLVAGAEELLASEAQEVAFNVDGFVDELMQRACTQSESELAHWLHGHEALYALQLKQFLTTPVANALANGGRLPVDENVGIVLTFFGLDKVGAHHPWVAHSLQMVWERLEDRRQFERVRRQYASTNAKAVDRLLWRELVSPRHWLRFLAILLCPGLPSRIRVLLLTLEQVAPREAQSGITAASARFWRLATDPDRLDWRRGLVVLARLPLILPVAAYIDAVVGTGVTLRGSAIDGGAVMVVWFTWAIAVLGWRRLARFNQEKLHWDLPLAAACGLLALALLAGTIHAGLVVPLCALAAVFWFAQRHGAVYWVGVLAAITGGSLVMSLGLLATPAGAPLGDGWWISAALYAVASVIAHDALHARIHHEPLAWARGKLGWLGWLLGGHCTLIAIVLIAAPVLIQR